MADTSLSHHSSAAPGIDVELVYAPAPRQMLRQMLKLPAGSTLADAVRASTLSTAPEVQEWLRLCMTVASSEASNSANAAPPILMSGIWGRRAEAGRVLRQDDRVELYRPLLVDPKVARRERFQRQGARNAGLFARRRAGAKSGY